MKENSIRIGDILVFHVNDLCNAPVRVVTSTVKHNHKAVLAVSTQGRVANPRPVATIKTGRVASFNQSQTHSDATGLNGDRSWICSGSTSAEKSRCDGTDSSLAVH